ncbi:MAG: outer membrane lipid asymmetry maintenance protein MlaD [Rhodospirillaceae bacterium]|nr:outer membrane lipid asymmetry maintenance protein MlaD [Rhodospirillaceae bacterium]MCY4311106.1 outer membrane lipid asymmetry maintenance protein MlaD [Rhodospirillaceae bacterium]
MGQKLIETVMGIVVLGVAILFFVFAWNTADLRPVSGYMLKASFASVGALAEGSDVKIGGVKVGTVTSQRIHPETFRAEISFTIRSELTLPEDTQASVTSDGLLGGKYLRLTPGVSKKKLAAGATLKKTRDALALEELLARAIFLLIDSSRRNGDGEGQKKHDTAR